MNHFRCVLLSTMAAVLAAPTGRFALAEDRPPSKLAFTRAASELRFDTGVLTGTLGSGGKSLGLRPVTHVASGVQVGRGVRDLLTLSPVDFRRAFRNGGVGLGKKGRAAARRSRKSALVAGQGSSAGNDGRLSLGGRRHAGSRS